MTDTLQYLVCTPDNLDYGRDADLGACKLAADRLGVGAIVEQLDEFLCRTGIVIYRVTEASLSDPTYDLFND